MPGRPKARCGGHSRDIGSHHARAGHCAYLESRPIDLAIALELSSAMHSMLVVFAGLSSR
jgi:hypothetical protein